MPIRRASWAIAPRILSARTASVASASGRMALVKIGLEDQLRRNPVAHRLPLAGTPAGTEQVARGRLGRETLVAESDRQAEAPLELTREALRPRGHRVRSAVGMRRQAHDEQDRTPEFD